MTTNPMIRIFGPSDTTYRNVTCLDCAHAEWRKVPMRDPLNSKTGQAKIVSEIKPCCGCWSTPMILSSSWEICRQFKPKEASVAPPQQRRTSRKKESVK
jgi:hypothetical protein